MKRLHLLELLFLLDLLLFDIRWSIITRAGPYNCLTLLLLKAIGDIRWLLSWENIPNLVLVHLEPFLFNFIKSLQ